MATNFNDVRAIKEELSGLNDISATIGNELRHVESRKAELDMQADRLMKLKGFADVEIARKRMVLAQLEELGK